MAGSEQHQGQAVDVPPASESSQDFMGKYRLIAHLGTGGMADVHLAVAKGAMDVNRLVVIKRLRDEQAKDETSRDVPQRGALGGAPQPPQRRAGERSGRRGRHLLLRHGVRRGATSLAATQPASKPVVGGSRRQSAARGAHRRRSSRRSPLRARSL